MPKASLGDDPLAGSYHVFPANTRSPGIVVLHAWWGLTDFVRQTCDRLATAGYAAIAPDLYHGATATTNEQAQKLRTKMKRPHIHQTLLTATTALQTHPATHSERIGVIGFSLGAHYALWLAEQPTLPITATVLFYGTRGGTYINSRSAFLGHFAAQDAWVSDTGRDKLAKSLHKSGKAVTFYTYPMTSHWFMETDRVDVYHAEAADRAWERTLTFLRHHLSA